MSRVEEITAILTEIACHLQSQQQDFTTNLTSTISSLNQTLNLNMNEGESRLGLRFQKEEFLQIGSSISRFDCEELVRACLDIIERLQGHHGTLSHMLFRVVLRATASASSHQIIQQCHQKNTSFYKLHSLLPEEISTSDSDIPLRQLLCVGLTSVLQLQIVAVLSVLDVLAQPIRWGLSMEMAAPVSCKTFLELVHFIKELIHQGDDHCDLVSKRSSINARMIDHKSTWALLMNFPVWFYFSASLLFTGRNCTIGAVKAQLHDLEKIRDAASRYLTWILSPTNEYLSDLLLNFFTENQDLLKTRARYTQFRENKNTMASKEYDGHAMSLWLNEFHDCHETFCKRAKVLDPRHSLLFRRIPLGIFIWVSDINEEACQCLFHYAASGSILPHDNKKSAMFSRKSDEKEEAIEGVQLVFDLFDVMAESIFDKESEGGRICCGLKVKAVRVLVMYLEKLLSFQTDEADGAMLMFKDLQRRLSMWKHQLWKEFSGLQRFRCNL
ncbi:hypothetical protein MKW92_013605 [Papaver armeniacum]|nr:hypothetical protein MKW92_013605 [Papaver armeniacum]